MVDLITLAIPVFLLSIALEAWIGRRRGLSIMRGPDVVTDLALGVMQTLVGVVFGGALVFLYATIYEHARLFTIPTTSVVAWVAVLVGVDFFYYWFHRAGHRVNIAWASHAPHHSSEDYNFAVALRQGPLQPFVSRFFYLPLALVGFPLEMMLMSLSINTIYQFFLHTELVRKLGPLEWILNTPSHHRVHHGCNGRYLDRNHAGMLIVWDRMFGTFEPEGERPIYGTVKQLGTWNPWSATMQPFLDIWRTARAAPRWIDKVRAPFMPPEWVPVGVDAGVWPDVATRPRFDVKPTHARGRYVTIMFVVTLAAVVAFLFVGASTLNVGGQSIAAIWLTLSFASLGALLDGRAWAPRLEIARAVLVVPIMYALLFTSTFAADAGGAASTTVSVRERER